MASPVNGLYKFPSKTGCFRQDLRPFLALLNKSTVVPDQNILLFGGEFRWVSTAAQTDQQTSFFLKLPFFLLTET